MIETFPYRVLASYNYDWGEEPVRSNRIAPEAPVSDVFTDVTDNQSGNKNSSSFSDISNIKGHDVFLQTLINAKAMADLKQQDIEVKWRGYTTKVLPRHLKFTRSDLLDRLLVALACVDKRTAREEEVNLI